MTTMIALIALCLAVIHALPPDKLSEPQPSHSVKIRSIDINNAHGLSMESRLSNHTRPSHYHLELAPYLDDGVFKGRVIINVTIYKHTDDIELHCGHNLEISSIKVIIITRTLLAKDPEMRHRITKLPIRSRDSYGDCIGSDDFFLERETNVGVKRFSLDVKKPVLNIQLNRNVEALSRGWIEISYSGQLQTVTSESFFKSMYLEGETEKLVAATQLRPNNARRVFPCFDEPSFLATFQLKIVRPKDMITLTNTNYLLSETIPWEPNAVWDLHEKTPLMPPSSFGLVIGDLKEIGNKTIMEDSNKNHIEIRVWGRTEFLPALEGVKERILRVLVEVANYWQLKLPLNKLDFVALPNYHGVKPADNWGLIIFRESDLSSQGYVQLAQELAYQWVGSYTTPAWWNYAHLNKALVGYVAAETAFKINHGSEMEGKWPMTVLYSIYYEFSKRYPHSRITGMKQETVCTKIELLLRMFNLTMGGPTFRQGLRSFISKRHYKTFTANDVWSSIEEAARQNNAIPQDLHIESVAESWIQKDRLPLVTVKRDYVKGTAFITQKLYLRERPHDVPDAARLSWILPVVLVRQDRADFRNTTPLLWLQTREAELHHMPDKNSFIIINPEEIAPFPVNYDEDNWHLLAKFLQSDKRTDIPELTRAKLLHDAWNLAYAGELSFAIAFDMTLFLKNETNHLVWDPVFTMIDHIGRQLTGTILPKFQEYVRLLLMPLYQSLRDERLEKKEGWRKNLRAMTKSFLCQAGDKMCVLEAQQEFKGWMITPNPDEGNPVANVYICPVFKWGTDQEWDFGFDRVINFPPSRKQSERTYLLKSLAGCATNEYKLTRLLNVTLIEGNANFTETDIYLIFGMLTSNEYGRNVLHFFVKSNWDFLKEKYFIKTNMWDSMMTAATSQFTTQEGMAVITAFYTAHKGEFGSAEFIVEKSLKNNKEEVHWASENLPIIEKWLNDYLAKYSRDEIFRN